MGREKPKPDRRRTSADGKRHSQAGRAILQQCGDDARVLYPDCGARPMKTIHRRYQDRLRSGYGSHHNGRHKLG